MRKNKKTPKQDYNQEIPKKSFMLLGQKLSTIMSLIFNLFSIIIYSVYAGIVITLKGFDWSAKLLIIFLAFYALIFLVFVLVFNQKSNFSAYFNRAKISLFFLKKLATFLYLCISLTVAIKSLQSQSRNLFVFVMAFVSVLFYAIQFGIWIYIKIVRKIIKNYNKSKNVNNDNKLNKTQLKLKKYQQILKRFQHWSPNIINNNHNSLDNNDIAQLNNPNNNLDNDTNINDRN